MDRPGGEIGRHAILRGWCRKASRFESASGHGSSVVVGSRVGFCHSSSVVEHSIRNRAVKGSIPFCGSRIAVIDIERPGECRGVCRCIARDLDDLCNQTMSRHLVALNARARCCIMHSRDVIRLLKNDGWVATRVHGSHHQFRHEVKSGTVTVPHPTRDLKQGTLRSIERQAGLKLQTRG